MIVLLDIKFSFDLIFYSIIFIFLVTNAYVESHLYANKTNIKMIKKNHVWKYLNKKISKRFGWNFLIRTWHSCCRWYGFDVDIKRLK